MTYISSYTLSKLILSGVDKLTDLLVMLEILFEFFKKLNEFEKKFFALNLSLFFDLFVLCVLF